MTTTPALNPRVLGQAEHAHRALLDRILADTGFGYHQWVALNLTAVSGPASDRAQLVDMITAALKTDGGTAAQVIAELAAAHMLEDVPGDGSRVQLSRTGQDLHGRIRTAVSQTIARLYRDIAADDLATAGRVLTLITARANAELADT